MYLKNILVFRGSLKLIDKKILEQKLREYKELLNNNHNEIQDG